MKRYLLLLPLLFLISCSNVDHSSSVISESNKPTIPITESGIFNLSEVSLITIEVSLNNWNTFLQNYDLNPANDKKIVSKFSFASRNGSVVLDSVGLRLKGNTSRRRQKEPPESCTTPLTQIGTTVTLD
jgi:hypothetical protein